jgi:hypothetical protein
MRRRWSWLALTGIVLAQVLSAMVGPGLIAWWNRPAVATPFACDEAMLVAVRQFVLLSAVASSGLVLLLLAVGLWWSRRGGTTMATSASQEPPQSVS